MTMPSAPDEMITLIVRPPEHFGCHCPASEDVADFELTVTLDHIRQGFPLDADECPVARSLGEHYQNVTAAPHQVRFEAASDRYAEFKPDPALERWILQYDDEQPVQPLVISIRHDEHGGLTAATRALSEAPYAKTGNPLFPPADAEAAAS